VFRVIHAITAIRRAAPLCVCSAASRVALRSRSRAGRAVLGEVRAPRSRVASAMHVFRRAKIANPPCIR
jgi:hypothetical protein